MRGDDSKEWARAAASVATAAPCTLSWTPPDVPLPLCFQELLGQLLPSGSPMKQQQQQQQQPPPPPQPNGGGGGGGGLFGGGPPLLGQQQQQQLSMATAAWGPHSGHSSLDASAGDAAAAAAAATGSSGSSGSEVLLPGLGGGRFGMPAGAWVWVLRGGGCDGDWGGIRTSHSSLLAACMRGAFLNRPYALPALTPLLAADSADSASSWFAQKGRQPLA